MKRRVHRVDLLTKREERSQVKKAFSLTLISVIIAFFIFTYGIPVLGGFADFLNKIFVAEKDTSGIKSATAPPVLDELPIATNSARLNVSGLALDATKIYIYLNDEKKDEIDVSGDHFKYEGLKLNEGENEIKVKSSSSNNIESDFSKVFKVVYDSKEPELSIDEPNNEQSFSGNNRILVRGKTEKDVQVLANGFLANINLEGNFEVFIPLAQGDSEIEVKATDLAGNVNSKKIRVHFSK